MKEKFFVLVVVLEINEEKCILILVYMCEWF